MAPQLSSDKCRKALPVFEGETFFVGHCFEALIMLSSGAVLSVLTIGCLSCASMAFGFSTLISLIALEDDVKDAEN